MQAHELRGALAPPALGRTSTELAACGDVEVEEYDRDLSKRMVKVLRFGSTRNVPQDEEGYAKFEDVAATLRAPDEEIMLVVRHSRSRKARGEHRFEQAGDQIRATRRVLPRRSLSLGSQPAPRALRDMAPNPALPGLPESDSPPPSTPLPLSGQALASELIPPPPPGLPPGRGPPSGIPPLVRVVEPRQQQAPPHELPPLAELWKAFQDLETENKALRRDSDRLSGDVEALRRDNGLLRGEVAELRDSLARLQGAAAGAEALQERVVQPATPLETADAELQARGGESGEVAGLASIATPLSEEAANVDSQAELGGQAPASTPSSGRGEDADLASMAPPLGEAAAGMGVQAASGSEAEAAPTPAPGSARSGSRGGDTGPASMAARPRWRRRAEAAGSGSQSDGSEAVSTPAPGSPSSGDRGRDAGLASMTAPLGEVAAAIGSQAALCGEAEAASPAAPMGEEEASAAASRAEVPGGGAGEVSGPRQEEAVACLGAEAADAVVWPLIRATVHQDFFGPAERNYGTVVRGDHVRRSTHPDATEDPEWAYVYVEAGSAGLPEGLPSEGWVPSSCLAAVPKARPRSR